MRARDLILAPELQTQEANAFLRGLGFRDPGRADDHLQQITGIVGAPRRLADLADQLLQEMAGSLDPDAALRNFESFLERVPSPLNLLAQLERDPHALEVLIGLLASSPYLTQSLLRNPEYFYWLIEGSRLEKAVDARYFKRQAEEAARPFSDSVGAIDALRRLHRRETLRIGSQDLLGRITLRETVAQLSDLADSLLQKSFEILANERLQTPNGFAVMALGKLGGRELNFSSDVDLLFVYGEEQKDEEILRFARDYNRSLGAFTGDGHLYRVDLRLRPMGKGGAIAYSEKAYRQYYQTWADTTDRLALIKCRHVAGDSNLGARFIASVQDFIFRKYLDQAAVEEIGWIKQKIDDSLRRRQETETDVKLGFGGIREIEFFAQSFQILYGGRHPELRTPNTLSALQKLIDGGFIKPREYERLCEAYVFLRDLEHKLQLVHDLQTHSLPQEKDELLRCARRMGYRVGEGETAEELFGRFHSDLRRHNQAVHEIFVGLFGEPKTARGLEELVLNSTIDSEIAVQRLRSMGIRESEEVWDGIQMLQSAPAFPHSPSRIRNLLANLVPFLVEGSQWARRPRDLFSRFDRFCEALGTRANLYSEIIENESLRDKLLRLLASGSFLAETLIIRPELFDSFVYSRTADDYLADLNLKLDRTPDDEKRDVLRSFKRREEFKVAIQELFGPGDKRTRVRLTELAEACIHSVFRQSIERSPALATAPFSLLALGKLGGKELIFHSDLDLVLVYDDSCTLEEREAVFGLIKAFRDWLQAYSTAGPAYKVDLRLRPEGKHTAEAIPLNQLTRYFDERAQAWERLAYVKARPILEQGCTVPLKELIYRSPFNESEVSDLNKIRKRKEEEIGEEAKSGTYDLKVGRGALMDVQFVVQLLQVNFGCIECNLLKAMNKLDLAGYFSGVQTDTLRKGLELFYALESMDDLLDLQEGGKISKEAERNDLLARWLGRSNGAELTAEYEKVTSGVRGIYRQYFGD